MNPISSYLLKRKANQEATLAAAIKQNSDSLQAAFKKDQDASQKVIDNLKDQNSKATVRRQAVDTYVVGAYTELTEPKLDPATKVAAATILTGFAKQNGDPVPAQDIAWLTPLLINTQPASQQDDDAKQKTLVDALTGKQAELDKVKQDQDKLKDNLSNLLKDKGLSDAQVKTLSDKLNGTESKVSEKAKEINIWLNKYKWLKSIIMTVFWWLAVPFGILFVLIPAAALFYPPLMPLSVLSRKLGWFLAKLIIMPVHSLIDYLEARFAAKAVSLPPTAPKP
jgi:response regulator of citrate/malate metabolism